mgnify:CR=1 FL=1
MTLLQQQALLKLAQQDNLIGTLTQTLLKDDNFKNLTSGPKTTDRTHPVQIPKPEMPNPIEMALEKVSSSIDQWARDARDHHTRIDKLMADRNHILSEANCIQREKLKLERARFEFMKEQNATFKPPLHESD